MINAVGKRVAVMNMNEHDPSWLAKVNKMSDDEVQRIYYHKLSTSNPKPHRSPSE